MQTRSENTKLFWTVLAISAILLSVATVYAQVNDLTFRFIRIQQDKVHEEMMAGMAGNPWQYRILADWLIDPMIDLFVTADAPTPHASAFIAFRFLQCLLIFMMAGMYCRQLGISLLANLLGLSVLAWSMSHSLYNSDLSFNVYFDIAFYLIGAILILTRRYAWIPLLMILAALNRETSALIPFMLIGSAYFDRESGRSIRPAVFLTALSLAIFLVIFVWLRSYYSEQPFLTADGYYPGVGLLVLNVTRLVTWEQLLLTLGIIPFLAISSYRVWPKTLKIFFWVVVPVWFFVHFVAALVAESRLLLVPQALIFIPGALLGISAMSSASSSSVNTYSSGQ